MSALIEEAMRQVDAASDKTRAAIAAEAYARCELVSLQLLTVVELDPSIVSFTIETGWEYDDQSSYYHTVTFWPERTGDPTDLTGELEDRVSDELMEIAHVLDEAACELLGGDGAVITVESLVGRAGVIS